VRAIAPRLASALARRRRRSSRGDEIDLRQSLRRAARRGGDIVDLVRRRRRVRRLRLVILCDVSGSMDRYSRALVQFLFALQNELRGVSTFVFSTRLHDITRLLKTRSFDEALARAGRDVDAWSGGTSIGACLEQFERRHARTRLDSRTVLLIVSDGWERGDPEQLRRAMAALRRRAYRIIWLNPLLGAADVAELGRAEDQHDRQDDQDQLDRTERTETHVALPIFPRARADGPASASRIAPARKGGQRNDPPAREPIVRIAPARASRLWAGRKWST
jgi:uncharacterized protein with von Willebrand factor type A (vWA) domain